MSINRNSVSQCLNISDQTYSECILVIVRLLACSGRGCRPIFRRDGPFGRWDLGSHSDAFGWWILFEKSVNPADRCNLKL